MRRTMDETRLNIFHKILLLNLGGAFEIYEYATVDENPNIFQKFIEIVSCNSYVPTNRFLIIRWFINGYTVMDSYPESAYEHIYTLEDMGKFVRKVVDKLKTRYENRPKPQETNKMEKTMKQEIEELKKEIIRLQNVITELEIKTRTYPTEPELYTDDLYNPNSYKTYPTHATNPENFQ